MKDIILMKAKMLVDWVVFLAATWTVAVISYEGLTGVSYPAALSLPVTIMDNAFILSVFLHFIYRKEQKKIRLINIWNFILIVVAYMIMFLGKGYASWMLLFWDMYLMLYYGYLVITEKEHKRNSQSL